MGSDEKDARHQKFRNVLALLQDPHARADASRLRRFHNLHKGETALLLGNGPSLARTGLSPAKTCSIVGSNRIFLGLADLGITLDYFVCINRLVAEQSAEGIRGVRATKFLPVSFKDIIREDAEDTVWFRSHGWSHFSRRPDFTGVFESATVTHAALQLLFLMGFSRILLVGVDHRFTTTGPGGTTVTAEGTDPNHFHPQYFANGFRWQLPDLAASERGYERARRVYQRSGREIVDCTVDGALSVFRKSSLESELGRLG